MDIFYFFAWFHLTLGFACILNVYSSIERIMQKRGALIYPENPQGGSVSVKCQGLTLSEKRPSEEVVGLSDGVWQFYTMYNAFLLNPAGGANLLNGA